MKIANCKHAYFLGIGGIGMSALARYFKRSGLRISGYDRDRTMLTKKLEAEGMDIHYEVDTQVLPSDIDMLVYTPAIPRTNALWVALSARGIPVYKRSEALQLALEDKKVIAVAGTHGKTTTTAFLAHILNWKKYRVTSFVGGIMVNSMSNFIAADSDWVLVEADEYDRSFLRLDPYFSLIQSMDPDHLDVYGEWDTMKNAFLSFAERTRPGGQMWINREVVTKHDLSSWRGRIESRQVNFRLFGHSPDDVDIGVSNIAHEQKQTRFTLLVGDESMNVSSSMPGLHNVMNAVGAAALACSYGIPLKEVAEAIASFKGIKRRFEIVHDAKDWTVIDDYAHHPVEIEAAINAVRNHFKGRFLTVVFQPHLYTRTRDFMGGFGRALDLADEVYLLPVYPAREEPIPGADSRGIFERMKLRHKTLVNPGGLANKIRWKKNRVLMFLGAGDIYRLIPDTIKKLNDDQSRI